MKKIKTTISYRVPHWNLCNSDNLVLGGPLVKDGCRFCMKTKNGYHCALYDEPLSSKDGLVSKLPACCKATAGAPSEIDEAPQVPTIPPRELMRQTIDLYNKTVNDLIAQGYPKQMAEMAAKKYILDE